MGSIKRSLVLFPVAFALLIGSAQADSIKVFQVDAQNSPSHEYHELGVWTAVYYKTSSRGKVTCQTYFKSELKASTWASGQYSTTFKKKGEKALGTFVDREPIINYAGAGFYKIWAVCYKGGGKLKSRSTYVNILG